MTPPAPNTRLRRASTSRTARPRAAKGDHGFADVWWKDKFAWEYKRKGKYKDLADAYRQLLQYRESLGNPPLLIVSDIARTEIHTNFTGTKKEVHSLDLNDFAKNGVRRRSRANLDYAL